MGKSSSGRTNRNASEVSSKTERRRTLDEMDTTPSRTRSTTDSVTPADSKRRSSRREEGRDDEDNRRSSRYSNASQDPYMNSNVSTNYSTPNDRNERDYTRTSEPDLVYRDSRRESRRESLKNGTSRGYSEKSSGVAQEDYNDQRKNTERRDSERSSRRRDSKRDSVTSRRSDRYEGSSRAIDDYDARLPDNQFPGSIPDSSTEPYRPPGQAADYYGDHGESVQSQPGVRPQGPDYVVNAEQGHLHAPSSEAAPPPEPSSVGQTGAAASYFDSDGEAGAITTSAAPSRPLRISDSQTSPKTSPIQPGRVYSRPSSVSVGTLGAVAAGVGAGAAANYFSGNNTQTSSQSYSASSGYYQSSYQQNGSQGSGSQQNGHQGYSQGANPPGRPSKISGSVGGSNHGAMAAAGVAGAAAAGYYMHHHHEHDHGHAHHPNTPYAPNSTGNHGPNRPDFSGMQQQMKHKHRGPLTKVADWFRDPHGVAQFEQYTEAIGVCRYCFDPNSSSADAPRRHYYHKTRPQTQPGRISTHRVDKPYRHSSSSSSSSDDEKKKRSSKVTKLVAGGLATYGAAKVGEAVLKHQNNFDDTYSVRSGQRISASANRVGDNRVTYEDSDMFGSGSKRSSTKASGRLGSTEEVALRRKDSSSSRKSRKEDVLYDESRHSRRRNSSASPSRLSKNAAIGLGAAGAAAGMAAMATSGRHRSRSRERSSGLNRKRSYYSKRVSPRHSYVDLSTKNTGAVGFGGFFSSPSANEKKGRKKGFFTWNNDSSSSSDADLAFGEGTVRRRTGKKGKDRRDSANRVGDTAAILGLAATGAALAAESDRRQGKSRRDTNDYTGHSSKRLATNNISLKDQDKRTEVDDEGVWEDASGDESSSDSVDTALAYGGRLSNKNSRESLAEQGTSKWAWRWNKNKDKPKGREKRTSESYYQQTPQHQNTYDLVSAGMAGVAGIGAGIAAAQASTQYKTSGTNASSPLPPMQYVDPFPVMTPNFHDARRVSKFEDGPSPHTLVSRSPVPIRQPQAVIASVVDPMPSVLNKLEADARLTDSPINITPVTSQKEIRRQRESSSSERTERRRRNSSPPLTNPSNLSKTSVSWNLTDEQLENERRALEKQERRRRRRGDEERRYSTDSTVSEQQHRDKTAADVRKDSIDRHENRRAEINKELEALYAEQERKLEEQKSLDEYRRKHGEVGGIGAAIIGAGVGAAASAMVSEAKRSSGSESDKTPRRKSSLKRSSIDMTEPEAKRRESAIEDDDDDEPKESKEEHDARIAAYRAGNTPSPVHDNYAAYFVPKEIAENVKANNDAADKREHEPTEVMLITPDMLSKRHAFSPYLYSPYRPGRIHDVDYHPRGVPRLQLVEATPPLSPAVRKPASSSPLAESSAGRDDGEISDAPLDRETSSTSGSKVTWADNQTHVFEVETPEYERNDPTVEYERKRTTKRAGQNEDYSKHASDESFATPAAEVKTDRDRTVPEIREPLQEEHSPDPSPALEKDLNDLLGGQSYQQPYFESVSDIGEVPIGDDRHRDIPKTGQGFVEPLPDSPSEERKQPIAATDINNVAYEQQHSISEDLVSDSRPSRTERRRLERAMSSSENVTSITERPQPQPQPQNNEQQDSATISEQMQRDLSQQMPGGFGVFDYLIDDEGKQMTPEANRKLEKAAASALSKHSQESPTPKTSNYSFPEDDLPPRPKRAATFDDVKVDAFESKSGADYASDPEDWERAKNKKSKNERSSKSKSEIGFGSSDAAAGVTAGAAAAAAAAAAVTAVAYDDANSRARDPQTISSIEPDFYASNSKDKKRRKSKRGSEVFDEFDNKSVMSLPATKEEERKSRRRSARTSEGFDDDDDVRSTTSVPAEKRRSRDKERDKERDRERDKEKEKRSSGLFSGLFSSNKSDVSSSSKKSSKSAKSESRGDRGDRGDRDDRDDQEDQEKRRKRRSKSSDYLEDARSIASEPGRTSRRRQDSGDVEDIKLLKHVADTADADDGFVSADEDARNGTASYNYDNEDQSFLAKGLEMPQPMVTHIPMDTDGVSGQFETERQTSVNYDILREASDQNLPPLPALTEAEEAVLTETETPPATPNVDRARRLSALRTSDFDSSPVAMPSPTAVPLPFGRRGPFTPGGTQRAIGSPSTTSPLITPRTRMNRPKSSSGKDFKPLYLIERHNTTKAATPDLEETLPSLPSSRTSSAKPSHEDLRSTAVSQESPADISDERGRRSRTYSADRSERPRSPDYLDSRASTPVPGELQRAREREMQEIRIRKAREAQTKAAFHSPSELLQDPALNREISDEHIDIVRVGSPLPSVVSTDHDQEFMSAESRPGSPLQDTDAPLPVVTVGERLADERTLDDEREASPASSLERSLRNRSPSRERRQSSRSRSKSTTRNQTAMVAGLGIAGGFLAGMATDKMLASPGKGGTSRGLGKEEPLDERPDNSKTATEVSSGTPEELVRVQPIEDEWAVSNKSKGKKKKGKMFAATEPAAESDNNLSYDKSAAIDQQLVAIRANTDKIDLADKKSKDGRNALIAAATAKIIADRAESAEHHPKNEEPVHEKYYPEPSSTYQEVSNTAFQAGFVPSAAQINAPDNKLGAFEEAFERAVRARGLNGETSRGEAIQALLPKRENAPFIPKTDLTPVPEGTPISLTTPVDEYGERRFDTVDKKKSKKDKRKSRKSNLSTPDANDDTPDEAWIEDMQQASAPNDTELEDPQHIEESVTRGTEENSESVREPPDLEPLKLTSGLSLERGVSDDISRTEDIDEPSWVPTKKEKGKKKKKGQSSTLAEPYLETETSIVAPQISSNIGDATKRDFSATASTTDKDEPSRQNSKGKARKKGKRGQPSLDWMNDIAPAAAVAGGVITGTLAAGILVGNEDEDKTKSFVAEPEDLEQTLPETDDAKASSRDLGEGKSNDFETRESTFDDVTAAPSKKNKKDKKKRKQSSAYETLGEDEPPADQGQMVEPVQGELYAKDLPEALSIDDLPLAKSAGSEPSNSSYEVSAKSKEPETQTEAGAEPSGSMFEEPDGSEKPKPVVKSAPSVPKNPFAVDFSMSDAIAMSMGQTQKALAAARPPKKPKSKVGQGSGWTTWQPAPVIEDTKALQVAERPLELSPEAPAEPDANLSSVTHEPSHQLESARHMELGERDLGLQEEDIVGEKKSRVVESDSQEPDLEDLATMSSIARDVRPIDDSPRELAEASDEGFETTKSTKKSKKDKKKRKSTATFIEETKATMTNESENTAESSKAAVIVPLSLEEVSNTPPAETTAPGEADFGAAWATTSKKKKDKKKKRSAATSETDLNRGIESAQDNTELPAPTQKGIVPDSIVIPMTENRPDQQQVDTVVEDEWLVPAKTSKKDKKKKRKSILDESDFSQTVEEPKDGMDLSISSPKQAIAPDAAEVLPLTEDQPTEEQSGPLVKPDVEISNVDELSMPTKTSKKDKKKKRKSTVDEIDFSQTMEKPKDDIELPVSGRKEAEAFLPLAEEQPSDAQSIEVAVPDVGAEPIKNDEWFVPMTVSKKDKKKKKRTMTIDEADSSKNVAKAGKDTKEETEPFTLNQKEVFAPDSEVLPLADDKPGEERSEEAIAQNDEIVDEDEWSMPTQVSNKDRKKKSEMTTEENDSNNNVLETIDGAEDESKGQEELPASNDKKTLALESDLLPLVEDQSHQTQSGTVMAIDNQISNEDEWPTPVKISKKDKKKKRKTIVDENEQDKDIDEAKEKAEDAPLVEEPSSEPQIDTTAAPDVERNDEDEWSVPTKASKKDKKKKRKATIDENELDRSIEEPQRQLENTLSVEEQQSQIQSNVPVAPEAELNNEDDWSVPTKASKKETKRKSKSIAISEAKDFDPPTDITASPSQDPSQTVSESDDTIRLVGDFTADLTEEPTDETILSVQQPFEEDDKNVEDVWSAAPKSKKDKKKKKTKSGTTTPAEPEASSKDLALESPAPENLTQAVSDETSKDITTEPVAPSIPINPELVHIPESIEDESAISTPKLSKKDKKKRKSQTKLLGDDQALTALNTDYAAEDEVSKIQLGQLSLSNDVAPTSIEPFSEQIANESIDLAQDAGEDEWTMTRKPSKKEKEKKQKRLPFDVTEPDFASAPVAEDAVPPFIAPVEEAFQISQDTIDPDESILAEDRSVGELHIPEAHQALAAGIQDKAPDFPPESISLDQLSSEVAFTPMPPEQEQEFLDQRADQNAGGSVEAEPESEFAFTPAKKSKKDKKSKRKSSTVQDAPKPDESSLAVATVATAATAAVIAGSSFVEKDSDYLSTSMMAKKSQDMVENQEALEKTSHGDDQDLFPESTQSAEDFGEAPAEDDDIWAETEVSEARKAEPHNNDVDNLFDDSTKPSGEDTSWMKTNKKGKKGKKGKKTSMSESSASSSSVQPNDTRQEAEGQTSKEVGSQPLELSTSDAGEGENESAFVSAIATPTETPYSEVEGFSWTSALKKGKKDKKKRKSVTWSDADTSTPATPANEMTTDLPQTSLPEEFGTSHGSNIVAEPHEIESSATPFETSMTRTLTNTADGGVSESPRQTTPVKTDLPTPGVEKNEFSWPSPDPIASENALVSEVLEPATGLETTEEGNQELSRRNAEQDVEHKEVSASYMDWEPSEHSTDQFVTELNQGAGNSAGEINTAGILGHEVPPATSSFFTKQATESAREATSFSSIPSQLDNKDNIVSIPVEPDENEEFPLPSKKSKKEKKKKKSRSFTDDDSNTADPIVAAATATEPLSLETASRESKDEVVMERVPSQFDGRDESTQPEFKELGAEVDVANQSEPVIEDEWAVETKISKKDKKKKKRQSVIDELTDNPDMIIDAAATAEAAGSEATPSQVTELETPAEPEYKGLDIERNAIQSQPIAEDEWAFGTKQSKKDKKKKKRQTTSDEQQNGSDAVIDVTATAEASNVDVNPSHVTKSETPAGSGGEELVEELSGGRSAELEASQSQPVLEDDRTTETGKSTKEQFVSYEQSEDSGAIITATAAATAEALDSEAVSPQITGVASATEPEPKELGEAFDAEFNSSISEPIIDNEWVPDTKKSKKDKKKKKRQSVVEEHPENSDLVLAAAVTAGALGLGAISRDSNNEPVSETVSSQFKEAETSSQPYPKELDVVSDGNETKPATEDEWTMETKQSKKDKKKKKKQVMADAPAISVDTTDDVWRANDRKDEYELTKSNTPQSADMIGDFMPENSNPSLDEDEESAGYSEKSKKGKKKQRHLHSFEEDPALSVDNALDEVPQTGEAVERVPSLASDVAYKIEGDKQEMMQEPESQIDEWALPSKKSKKDKKKRKSVLDDNADPSVPTSMTDSHPVERYTMDDVILGEPGMTADGDRTLDTTLSTTPAIDEASLPKPENKSEPTVEDEWATTTKKPKKDKKKRKQSILEENLDPERPSSEVDTKDVLDTKEVQSEAANNDLNVITPAERDKLELASTRSGEAEQPVEELWMPSKKSKKDKKKNRKSIIDMVQAEESGIVTRSPAETLVQDGSGQQQAIFATAKSIRDSSARDLHDAPVHQDFLDQAHVKATNFPTIPAKSDRRQIEVEAPSMGPGIQDDVVHESISDNLQASYEPLDPVGQVLQQAPISHHERPKRDMELDDIRSRQLSDDFDGAQHSDAGSDVSESTRERRRRRRSPPLTREHDPEDLPRDRALTPPPDHDDIMDTALTIAAGLGFGDDQREQPQPDPVKPETRQLKDRQSAEWGFDRLKTSSKEILTQNNRDSGIQFDSPVIVHESPRGVRDSGFVPSPPTERAWTGGLRVEESDDARRSTRPHSPTSSNEDLQLNRRSIPFEPQIPKNDVLEVTPARRQPTPVDPASKERSSVLFNSSPAGSTPNKTPRSDKNIRSGSRDQAISANDLHRTSSAPSRHSRGQRSLEELSDTPSRRRKQKDVPSGSVSQPAILEARDTAFTPPPRQSAERQISPSRMPLGTIKESGSSPSSMAAMGAAALGLGAGALLTSSRDRDDPSRSLGTSQTRPGSQRSLRGSATSTEQHDPSQAGVGIGTARGMSENDYYDGYGSHPGSPMSPTRPPSVRKRQSMQQIRDLEVRVDQLAQENRSLAEAKLAAEKHLEEFQSLGVSRSGADDEALQSAHEQLQQRDNEISKLRAEITTLAATHATLKASHDEKHTQFEQSTRELQGLRSQHEELSTGMQDIVKHEIAAALAAKEGELQRLRHELENARIKIKELQSQILARGADDIIIVRDEDYFDVACQNLCQHVQGWVVRFSKFSDTRVCRTTNEVRDEKTVDRFDNALLDGSDVDAYLSDRVKRRDVFMSVVMTLIWEYVFTRYLFGMDREQRQKLKQLEKNLAEVGPAHAVHQWRALTLTLLSKRESFREQCEKDTEAVVVEIVSTLSKFLPPPQNLEAQIYESLRKVTNIAVQLSIEMRTQKAEYIMLPPLTPEYDTNGDLAQKFYFNANLMNERSGEFSSNDELQAQKAVVRVVLFPLVMKKGDDNGQGDEEIVVCPAQVLVVRADRGKRPKSRIASGASDARSLRAASTHSLAISGIDMTEPGQGDTTGYGNMI